MKAIDLLDEIKNQIICKPEEEQSDALTHKYGNQKDGFMNDAASIVENYGNILSAPIIQVMTDLEKKQLGETVIASIPLHTINARTYRADVNEYLIVINQRLLALIYAWGELQFLPFIKPDPKCENFAQVFAPVVDCYLTPNSGSALPILSYEEIPQPITQILALKAQYSEQFIVAHELAHIVLGHLDKADAVTFHEDSYEFCAEAYNLAQQKEYDADIQAVRWLIKSLKLQKIPDDMLFFCIEVFVLFHFIECNLGCTSKSASHPTALSRLINIQNHYPDIKGLSEMVENCKNIRSFKIVKD